MSSGYCTKLGTEHCSIIRIVLCGTTFTLLKKRCQCFVDAPMLRSHRRQRPLTDNKEKPQPHSDSDRLSYAHGAAGSRVHYRFRSAVLSVSPVTTPDIMMSSLAIETIHHCYHQHWNVIACIISCHAFHCRHVWRVTDSNCVRLQLRSRPQTFPRIHRPALQLGYRRIVGGLFFRPCILCCQGRISLSTPSAIFVYGSPRCRCCIPLSASGTASGTATGIDTTESLHTVCGGSSSSRRFRLASTLEFCVEISTLIDIVSFVTSSGRLDESTTASSNSSANSFALRWYCFTSNLSKRCVMTVMTS